MQIGKTVRLLVFITTTSTVSGQPNGFEGLIITQDRDTIEGTVQFKDRERNPEYIDFIKDGESVRYFPEQLLEFEKRNAMRFSSGHLKYCTNPHKLNRLSDSENILWTERWVFLRVLIEGELNLYEFVDDDSKLHLVIGTQSGELIDLLEFRYEADGDIGVIARYRTQLKQVMHDCREIFRQIDGLPFNQSSIIRIVKEYHQCQGVDIAYEDVSNMIGLSISLQAGMTSVNHFISGEKTVDGYEAASAEIDVEFILPRSDRLWMLFSGLGFRRYHVPLSRILERDQTLNYLRLNTGFKRILVNKAWRLDFSAGITNSTLLNSDGDELRSYEQGWLVGIGIRRKRARFDFKYEVSNGYSLFDGISTKVQTYFIMLGYVLFENAITRQGKK